MSDILHIAGRIPASTVSSGRLGQSDFPPIALGLGLLLLVVAALTGVQGVWY